MSGAWKVWEGQVVDGICLQQLLGSGDESAVFLTEYGDPEPGKAVIKLVRVNPGDAGQELRRWERAAQLSHPHLIRLLQTGICKPADSGLLYAVMEYAEENLADVCRYRPLSEVEAREMLAPVLDALAYIHGEGLVHGHLKAANVLAVADQVKISSEGISKTGEPGRRPRHPGPYDPPEFQSEGISPAGDVWSLGMILVEALTRQLPSQGRSNRGLLTPETLPAVFLELARSCLQPDPRRRPTVAGIAARLRQPSAAPAAPTEAGPRTASRTWRYAVPAAAAAGVALAAILAGPRLLHRPAAPTAVEQPRAPAQGELKPAEPPARQATESTGNAVPHRTESARRAKVTAAPGQVVHQVLPEVTRQARNTIHGTVRISVRAQVDSSGRVVSARLESPGPSKYLAARTLEAARRWEFQPAAEGSSEWILRFELTRTATIAHPVRVSP